MEPKDREQKRRKRKERRRRNRELKRGAGMLHRYDSFYGQRTNHDWMFVYTGTSTDIMSYVSVLLLNPAFIFYGIIFVTGRIYNIFLMYLIIDGITILGWVLLALHQKKEQDEWNRMTYEERMEYCKKLVDSLSEIEDERKMRDKK